MSPATLQRLRRAHRWLGLFFAPLIAFFAFTGMLQILDAADWPLPSAALELIDKLQDGHEDQRLRRGTTLQPVADGLVIAMAVSLIATTLLGVLIAWRMYPRQRKLTLLTLALGVAVPLAVMLF